MPESNAGEPAVEPTHAATAMIASPSPTLRRPNLRPRASRKAPTVDLDRRRRTGSASPDQGRSVHINAFHTVSTDDAYVNGHVTYVAPRVPGQVVEYW